MIFTIGLFNSVQSFSQNGTQSSSFGGNTLYVGGDGPGNYSSISDAIINANDGDTILVYSGTYNEWIRLYKQLFIRGIKKPGKDYPIIDGGNDHHTIIIYADGCSLEDFKVKNGVGGFGKAGIILESDKNLINNCKSYHTGRGLVLESSCNNTISNNHMTDGHWGIVITASHNNTIVNNWINDHNSGEVLFNEGSENNYFYNNTVLDCGPYDGLELSSSDNNFIIGNNISDSYCGLKIVKSSNIVVKDNILWKNGRGFIIDKSTYIDVKDNIFLRNSIILKGTAEQMETNTFENNLVNGKHLYFYSNEYGITVPEDAGQIILVKCTGFTIKNCNITRVDYGVQLINSSNNEITYNYIHSVGPEGIKLSNSPKNLLSHNHVKNCKYGLVLGSSESNIISNNFFENNDRGLELTNSDKSEIFYNEFINNGGGIKIVSCDGNNIYRNNIIENLYDGIEISAGSNNIISYNNISNGESVGIEIRALKNSEIFGNNISDFKIGIECSTTKSNKFSKNTINKNNNGIKLSNAKGDHFEKNHIEGNAGYGFSLSRSKDILIKMNNIIDNNLNAVFSNFFPNFFRNKWIGNFWDDYNKTLFYKIQGKFTIEIYSFIPFEPPREITFSWSNFDMRPAKKPIDINDCESVKTIL